jgi:single-stranded-DNA-specific exonuclease
MTSDVQLVEPPRRIGSGERHLSLRLAHHGLRLRAVAFGQGEWCDEIAQCPTSIDIAYRPVINEFQGRRNVELHLVDWRPSRVPATATS